MVPSDVRFQGRHLTLYISLVKSHHSRNICTKPNILIEACNFADCLYRNLTSVELLRALFHSSIPPVVLSSIRA